MATEAQLRRRMSELQREMEELRRQKESFQNEMFRNMNDQMNRFRTEYEAALRRQQEETEELYAERLRRFQEKVIGEARESYRKLEKEAEKTARLQQEKLEELSACNEELRAALRKVKERSEEMDALHGDYAKARMKEVDRSRQETDQTPHEFFFDGEFHIIDSHAKQIGDEIRQQMYQAASADASSVIMEFDLLKTKVEQALYEWMQAFQDYSGIIRMISQRLNVLESQQIQTAAGTFLMKPGELNFWSSGTYLPFKNKVMEAMEFIQEIQQSGVTKYLKSQKKKDRKSIFSKVTEAQKWNDELSAIINCILCERMFSDERWFLAKRIAGQLDQVGYGIVKRKFREPTRELKTADWYPAGEKFQQNPLECYDLVETIQGLDLLCISIVPVREHGVTVRNECLVSMKAKILTDRETVTQDLDLCIQRIHQVAKQIRAQGIDAGEKQAQILQMEEERRKGVPDPADQIRYLERKYQ